MQCLALGLLLLLSLFTVWFLRLVLVYARVPESGDRSSVYVLYADKLYLLSDMQTSRGFWIVADTESSSNGVGNDDDDDEDIDEATEMANTALLRGRGKKKTTSEGGRE